MHLSLLIQGQKNAIASDTDKGWSIALSVLNIILLIAVLASHIASSPFRIFIGTKIEGIFIMFMVIFSTILVSTITSPDRGLAVDTDGAVYSGNMYYFGWAGFINGIVIASSYVESAYGINVRNSIRSSSNSFSYWTALLFTSMIVMGTSSDIYSRNCEVADKPQPYCQRTVLAISIGTIGVVFSLIIVATKLVCGSAPFLLEAGSVCFLFGVYVLELAYVTDPQGPGSPLGNLYYFSWISFLLTFMVGKACHQQYVDAKEYMEQQQQSANQPMPTLQNVVGDEDEEVRPTISTDNEVDN